MSKRDIERRAFLKQRLQEYRADGGACGGIEEESFRGALIEQLIESIHRVEVVQLIASRDISPLRSDPNSLLFDPLKAAVLAQKHSDPEEAFWLVFLFVHFGKNGKSGWRLLRDVYGALGSNQPWDWARVSADPSTFTAWLRASESVLRGDDGVRRGFGNHRKYESLSATSVSGTAAVFQSYVEWIGRYGSHMTMLAQVQEQTAGDPKESFDVLYESMRDVRRFGRTARFDYLAMLGKLRLAPIVPKRLYLEEATGPLSGAKLFLFGNAKARSSIAGIESQLIKLDKYIQVGMQALEDALCNWQKSPSEFVRFRG